MFSCNDEVCVFFVYNYPLWFSIFDSGSIMELFCVTGVLNADPYNYCADQQVVGM